MDKLTELLKHVPVDVPLLAHFILVLHKILKYIGTIFNLYIDVIFTLFIIVIIIICHVTHDQKWTLMCYKMWLMIGCGRGGIYFRLKQHNLRYTSPVEHCSAIIYTTALCYPAYFDQIANTYIRFRYLINLEGIPVVYL